MSQPLHPESVEAPTPAVAAEVVVALADTASVVAAATDACASTRPSADFTAAEDAAPVVEPSCADQHVERAPSACTPAAIDAPLDARVAEAGPEVEPEGEAMATPCMVAAPDDAAPQPTGDAAQGACGDMDADAAPAETQPSAGCACGLEECATEQAEADASASRAASPGVRSSEAASQVSVPPAVERAVETECEPARKMARVEGRSSSSSQPAHVPQVGGENDSDHHHTPVQSPAPGGVAGGHSSQPAECVAAA